MALATACLCASLATTATAEFLRELVIDDFSSVGDPLLYPYSAVNHPPEWPFHGAGLSNFVDRSVLGTIGGLRHQVLLSGPATTGGGSPAEESFTATATFDEGSGLLHVASDDKSAPRFILAYYADDESRPRLRLDTTSYTHVAIDYAISHELSGVVYLANTPLAATYPETAGSVVNFQLLPDQKRLLISLQDFDEPAATIVDGVGLVEIPPVDLSVLDIFYFSTLPQRMDDIPGGVTFTLDKISLVSVPEPSAAGALAVGWIGLLRRRRG